MESATERIQLLLNDLEVRDGGLAALYHDGASEWALQYEDETVVHLSWRERHPRLELACSAGPLPEAGDLDLLKSLLMFNFLTEDSAGARLALSGDNEVRLLRDLALQSLELAPLKSALQGLRACARDVKAHLLEWAPAASTAGDGSMAHQPGAEGLFP